MHNEGTRILVSGGLAVGGVQTHVTLLCGVLRRAGAEVTVAAAVTNWPTAALADLRASGIRVVVSPFGFGRWKLLGTVWSILTWPFLLRRDYQVVYCIGEGKMHRWAMRFAARDAFKVYHEIVECPRRGSVAEKLAQQMDGVIANSKFVAQRMADLLRATKVRSLPFLTSSAPAEPSTWRRRKPNELLRIAFLGRLTPHKNPGKLIEALPAWMARGPVGPARLDLYGGDHDGEGERLQGLIRALKLEGSVSLQGSYETGDLARILAATDLVVLPSEYEGLPLVLVEAMLRGIPVVATSAGGTAELGEENPDVIITEGTEWRAFQAGVEAMAMRIREGQNDGPRLQAWTEARYGHQPVAESWRRALLTPNDFFAEKPAVSPTHAVL